MRDETLHAITAAIEALQLAHEKLEQDRDERREAARHYKRAQDAAEGRGFRWVTNTVPTNALKFEYSVAQVRREGEKLPTPDKTGYFIPAESVKVESEE